MRSKLWAFARPLAGVAIIALLLWRLGTVPFLDGLAQVRIGALRAAFGVGVLATVFSAWRWCLVARGLGVRLPMRGALADYYQALFLNATLPGGLLGDVDRAVRHGRDTGSVGRGLRAVFLERTAGQAVLFVVGIPVVLFGVRAVHVPPAGALVILALVVAALAAGARLSWRSESRWGNGFRTAVTDARRGLLGRRSWPGIVLASAVVLAAHLATFVLAARSAGSAAPLSRLVPLMLLALIVMGLPLNVGGFGPREGVCAWAFAAAGLGATQGVTIAVVYGLFAFIASLPGIVVLATRWVLKLHAARERRARLRLIRARVLRSRWVWIRRATPAREPVSVA